MSDEIVKRKELFRRFLTTDLRAKEGAEKTLTFPASSDTPIERWYGMEVLSHAKGAVKLGRAKDGAMPLLFNHDLNDPIGMIQDARLEDGRMIVDAAFFETGRAKEVQQMLEGGLRNVSLAYRVNTLEENKKTGTFTATDWEPYEVSIVTVPADPSVGIGRGIEGEYEMRMIREQPPADNHATTRRDVMSKAEETVAVATASAKTEEPVTVISGAELEKRRKESIANLCKMASLDENYRDHYIGTGMSVEEVSNDILKVMEVRGKTNPQSVTKLGLTATETRQYSLVRAINACATKDWKSAGFELECTQQVAKRMNVPSDPNKFYIPYEVLTRPENLLEADQARKLLGLRDLSAGGGGGSGGFLVGTTNVGFIDMLYNRSVVLNMGAMRLSGLQGNITYPRMSVSATGQWLANETAAASESQQTFVQVGLTPHNVSAYTEISRQLLLQSSPGVEGIVSSDLARVVAVAADLAGLNGSGAAGQPQGIIGTGGVSVTAAASASYATVLGQQATVAGSNVMPAAGGYVTTPTISATCMQRQRFTSTDTPIWEGNVWDGRMVGFRSMSSNQMPGAGLLFGDWSEVIIAEWGVLEVEVNPYANFQAGIIGVRAIYSMDVGVRRPFAFAHITTAS